jgi:predicted RNA-binding Zn-ribbon protein involved in translation (DUF1610 family)
MNIYVCEDCGFEVKCRGCHSWCPRCAGNLVVRDYVLHKLAMEEKNGDNNKS